MKPNIKNLPDSPGIYKFYDLQNNLLYVGKSVSIKKRVTSYFTSKNLGPKISLLVSKIDRVEFIKVFSEFEALLLEAELIRTNQPFYNSEAKDDKSPIYIKISSGDIPLISFVRRPSAQKSGEFIKGPFPSSKETRSILKMVRKIFPYCHHKNAKKPCLYVHLGLCPFPYGSEETRIKYQKTIRKIKELLSGKSTSLVNTLTKEMKNASKGFRYEEASEIKKQIEKLEYLKSQYHSPREFLEMPTLVDDLTAARLKDLKEKLDLTKIPKRIECYDVSNISGKNATGSMVVATNGRIDKSQYRKFKIKFKNTPDDYEMLREVLSRRFKNDWPRPDLIIIDGGKGQLNAVISVLRNHDPTIAIVSLAKRLEEIYVPTKVHPKALTKGRGPQALLISLPKESPARQLAQQIRDEAHRFAITYHRLLRSKNFLKAGK